MGLGIPLLPRAGIEQPDTDVNRLRTIDELWPAHFSRYQLAITLACSVTYGLGAITVGLASFLLPRLDAAGWELSSLERTLASSLLLAGNFAGLLFWGVVCDRFGRLFGLRCGVVLMACTIVATFVAPSVTWLLAARVLAGVANGAVMNASFVLLAELTAPHNRMLAKALQECGFSSGLLLLSLVAWCARDAPWQALSLAFAPSLLCSLGAALTLPESPRFLLASGDAEGAMRVLASVCDRAGRPLAPGLKLRAPQPALAADYAARRHRAAGSGACGVPLSNGGAARPRTSPFMQLWHPSLRRRTCLVCAANLGSTLVYYGVLFAPPVFATSSPYVQSALGALLELPSFALMKLCGDCIGRPLTWTLLLLLGAVPLLALALLPAGSPTALVLPLVLCGRLGATGASTICYVAAAEQFPTTCRSLGVSLGAALGRLGSIASPFLLLLPNPQLVLASVAALAAVCAAALPETKGREIPDDVEECE